MLQDSLPSEYVLWDKTRRTQSMKIHMGKKIDSSRYISSVAVIFDDFDSTMHYTLVQIEAMT